MMRLIGIDPNDTYSYEDWMNDMATREPRNRRGWQAQYQTRCDCCGRFTQPGAPGSSWVMVPHSDVSMGDERERCPACTEKHGPAECGPQYVKHLCCGVVPNARVQAAAEGGRAWNDVLGTDVTGGTDGCDGNY